MFLPYVYIVNNRNTGKFYIGMRSANKVVAEQDLGTYYFTSSKHIKNNFAEYDIKIVAYFIDQISAFEFENDLIKEHWGNPLLLNRHYQKSMSKFSMTGAKRSDLAEYNRITKSKPKEIRKYKCSHCNTDIIKTEFCHHLPKEYYYCNAACRNRYVSQKKNNNLTGKEILVPCEKCGNEYYHSPRSKAKFRCCSNSCRMLLVLKDGGHPAWNKGLPNPQAAINGRKGAKKQSNTAIGRKRKYLPNGKWTYEYPNK